MTETPLPVKIIQAFIKHQKSRLTASEIAETCNVSRQAVSYHLKKMSHTSLILLEKNSYLNQIYYYVNDFFLNPKLLDQAREALHPYIQFFVDSFYFSEEMSDKDIEKALIEFIYIIAWLFSQDSKNDFDKII